MTAKQTITPEEARKALELVEETTRQLRRSLAYGGLPYFLLIWGIVWTLGFGATHFLGPESPAVGVVWATLDGLGAIASFVVGATLHRKIRSPYGARLGFYWLAWIFYGILLIYFAQPQTSDQVSLLIALLAMMGYVTSGLLYRSRLLVLLGLSVTVLIVAGYLVFPAFFNLWMALLGGGSLIGAGLYILWAWRE